MAEETILDQALAMIPGMRAKKKSAPSKPSRAKQLSILQKSLAALTKDLAKLAVMMSDKPVAAKKPAASSSRKTTRKVSKKSGRGPATRASKTRKK